MCNYFCDHDGNRIRVSKLESDANDTRRRIRVLESEIECRRDRVNRLSLLLEDLRKNYEFRKSRFSPKEENQVPLSSFLIDPNRYDSVLGALHPFRKFRSISNSLYEERRLACIAILSMFRFRFINIQKPASPAKSYSEPRTPSTELVGDFDALDGTPDQMHVVLLFVVPVLIGLSRILDLPIPFPIVYGTMVSSPNLHSPYSALESGCPPYPRILQAYRRVLSPICTTQGVAEHPPVVFKNSVDLLSENLRYMAMIQADGTDSVPPTVSDPVAILSYIVRASNAPQSPSMSPRPPPSPASPRPVRSPLVTSRKAVIEQTLAEGGEWTLLDQL